MSLKKILAVVMASAMAIGAFAASALTLDVAEAANETIVAEEAALAAEEATVSVWDGTSFSLEWLTAGDPEKNAGDKFYLNSAEDLAGFAYYVNTYASTNNIFTGDTVYLTVDVDLDNKDWNPIGTAVPGEKNRFYGSFDGQGHTISNLKIAEGHYYAGLFGQIATYNYTQTFSNITINNVYCVAENETASGKNKEAAGALIGRANGTIVDNCHVTGEIYISGERFVGGILGHSYAKISNCSVVATGTINADTWQAGGLVGAHGATATYTSSIENCTVAGTTDEGLTVTSYYTAAGGAVGAVSLSGVTETTIDCVTVANVSVEAVSNAFGSGLAYIASGYEATNSGFANVTVKENGVVTTPSDSEAVPAYAAEVGGKYYTSLASAINAAKDGDTVKVMPGTYSAINISNKNITLEGTVADNGELLTEIKGGNPAITMHGFNGTVKNLKITNAFKIAYAEPAGNVTFDNIYATGATYGLHLVAYSKDLTWNLQNSYIDLSWANSFGTYNGGYANINIKKNVFESTTTYYPDYGAPVVNSFSPNVVVEDNVFGANTKIYLRTEEVAENATIGTNYYEDGAENAFVEDSDSFETPISSYYEDREMTTVGYAPVFVGENGYYSVQEAINAANDGAVIEIQPGTYEEALRIEKSVTLKGVAAKTSGASLMADEKPVIIIKDVTNGGVQYYAPNVTLDNIKFVVAEEATGSTWNVSAVGYYYEDTKNKDGLTITNCDFVNESDISMSAIAANIGKYTVTNNTFKNFTTMVHSFVDHGAVDEVVISGNRFEDVENIASVYYGAPEDGTANITVTNNKSADGSKAKVIIDDFGMTKAAPATSYNTVTVSDNDATIIVHNFDKDNFTFINENNAETVNTYRTEAIMRTMDGALPDGVVYVQYGTDKEEMFIVVNGYVKTEAETVELIFKPNTSDAEALENSVWDMYLVASDGEIINRLNSGDFTFVLDSANKMAYEIIASNDEVSVNNVAGDRYEFHYDGKTNTETDTALEIKIATVKFTGYGTFTFGVKVDGVDTNAVHATTYVDNIVDSYTVGAGLVVNTDTDSDTDGVIESEIVVPTKALTIKVAFPNNVNNNVLAYQKMNVLVTGEDIDDISIDLGTDNTGKALAADSKHDCKYTVVFDEAACEYTVTVENILTVNTAYNVTVSGAGYRTARYTVTMTDAKVLNFWNNVKDNTVEVEEGKASSAVAKNFLAGDIVADNNINIYDLSAVVSYFATDATTDYDKYVKYDLNRDGKIDSKDVAYVLVSWGN